MQSTQPRYWLRMKEKGIVLLNGRVVIYIIQSVTDRNTLSTSAISAINIYLASPLRSYTCLFRSEPYDWHLFWIYNLGNYIPQITLDTDSYSCRRVNWFSSRSIRFKRDNKYFWNVAKQALSGQSCNSNFIECVLLLVDVQHLELLKKILALSMLF